MACAVARSRPAAQASGRRSAGPPSRRAPRPESGGPPGFRNFRDAISDLYDAWWDKRAPERSRAERAAATAARRRTITGNWCAPAALDDDELDIPGYRPKSGWKPATGTGTATDIRPPTRPRPPKKDT